jgi:hypothetical protein
VKNLIFKNTKILSSSFEKLRKATVSFVMCVCPSVRPSVRLSEWNNSAPTVRILIKFVIWVFFEKSVEKIQVLLKSDKNNEYSAWRPIQIYGHITLNGLFCWICVGCWKSVGTVLPTVTRIMLSPSYSLDWAWTGDNRSHFHPKFGGRIFPTRPAPRKRLSITVFGTPWKLGSLQFIKILSTKFGSNYTLRLMETPSYTMHVWRNTLCRPALWKC